jgi:oligopeptide/dipeptide ABC transporter ATP-binding protein
MPGPLLRVRDLTTSFQVGTSRVRAVDRVSFDVEAGASLGIVGESGCGKSVTALSILRLLPSPPAHIDSGSIELEGRDLLRLTSREMRAIRGNEISMVFQEPMTSLNPVYTVGAQIVEAIRLHQKRSRGDAWKRAVEMLRTVGIPAPETNARAFPHQLSGGMRQRVMIAMAIACEPKLLLADEPTTALDVTIQAQILATLHDLRTQMGMAILLITHDLGVVAEHTDHVAVMYAAQVVESAPVASLFSAARHPYTRGLLQSIPRPVKRGEARSRLSAIEGMVPDLGSFPPGCRFADRCPRKIDACTQAEPELLPVDDPSGPHLARCIRASEP